MKAPAILSDPARRWALLRWLVAAVLCVPAVKQLRLLLGLYLSRYRYPFDVEWLESSALYQAYRHMTGQTTYAPPSNGYLPLFHPPGYPMLLAVIGKVIHLDYPMARTVTFAFFVLACLLVTRALWQAEKPEGRVYGLAGGVLAAGLAAAGTSLFEGFYDLVREDCMAWTLCIAAAVLAGDLGKKPTERRLVLLALLCTAAVYTRLVTVFLVWWIHLFVIAVHGKKGIKLGLYTICAGGLALVALQWTSRGWFWLYCIGLIQDHPVDMARLRPPAELVIKAMPYLYALPALLLILGLTRRASARTLLWFGLVVTAIPAALLPYAKSGGFANDLMPFPMLAGGALLFALGDCARALGRWPRIATVVRFAGLAGVAGLLTTVDWEEHRVRYTPKPEHWVAARRLDDTVKGLRGGIITPRHPFLAVHNGIYNPQYSDMPVLDAYWANMPGLSLGPYLDKSHARWALMSGNEQGLTLQEMVWRYQFDHSLAGMPGVLVGEYSQLRLLLQWQRVGPGVHVLFDFEDPTLPNWDREGDAFSVTTARPRGQSPLYGVIDRYAANSFAAALGGDRATGRLLSPPFRIDRERLAFRVGGGRRTRVELWADGRAYLAQSPVFPDLEVLFKVEWDVKSLMGKEARIRLVDDDPGYWGHLLADHFERFYDAPK